MTKVKFTFKSAGYCEAKESHAIKGGANRMIKFYATYAIIEHPTHGHILFDTGYTRRFYEITKRFPYKIYALATKVFIQEEEEVQYVLKKAGINPVDIKYIIVSHFHADHIGGLKDFPNAQFFCSAAAFEDIQNKKGIGALKKGFLPSLLPSDFQERMSVLKFTATEDKDLGKMADLFDDGSILLCQLSGHAKGQIGALLNTAERKTFLIADAAWFKSNVEQLTLPNPIVRLFFDSWSDFKASLQRVHNYHKSNPETFIIPCHCEETLNEINQKMQA